MMAEAGSMVKELVSAFIFAVMVYALLHVVLRTSLPLVSVVSDSMVPVINRGDLLVVVGMDNYKPGDVVVYRVSAFPYPIVHRLLGKETIDGREYWVIKGDNNPSSDPWYITDENIVGKVVWNFPLLGIPRMLVYRLVGI